MRTRETRGGHDGWKRKSWQAELGVRTRVAAAERARVGLVLQAMSNGEGLGAARFLSACPNRAISPPHRPLGYKAIAATTSLTQGAPLQVCGAPQAPR
jgi:hypothetical protein